MDIKISFVIFILTCSCYSAWARADADPIQLIPGDTSSMSSVTPEVIPPPPAKDEIMLQVNGISATGETQSAVLDKNGQWVVPDKNTITKSSPPVVAANQPTSPQSP